MRKLASVALLVLAVYSQVAVAAESAKAPTDDDRENPAIVQDGSSALTAREETLKVLTYNVQFRPALADVLHPQWPNTSGRAQAIGRAIAQYDIVALQEVFRTARLNEIVSAANTTGL